MPKLEGKPKVFLEEFRVKNAPEDYGMADEKWNFKKFAKNLRIAIVRMDNFEMEFDLIGVQPAFANAFRRIMLSEVPSMAIEKVMIRNNTSIIQDEVLAHRLGLIPLKADPRLFEYRPEDATEGTDFNTLEFSLKVKCSNNKQTKDSFRPEDLYEHHSVYSSHIKWCPLGNQASVHKEASVGPVHGDILISKMRPGHELDLHLVAVKGIGKDHAKFSPVATASYRLLPEITLTRQVGGGEATLLQGCFSPGVIGIDSDGNAFVQEARYDTCSRNVYRYDEIKDSVILSRIRDHFIFNVESIGAMPPNVIFIEAVKILRDKCEGQSLSCPAVRTTSGWLDLFPLPCRKHAECRSVMGPSHLCCKGFCTKGLAAQQAQRTNDAKSSVEPSSTSTTTSTSSTTTTTTTTTTTSTTPSTTSSTTTTTTPAPTTTTTTTALPILAPLRPFLQLLPIQTTQATKAKKSSSKSGSAGKAKKLVCPKGQASFELFPIPCENTAQCRTSSGPDQVCCQQRCVKGVPAPRPKQAQKPHQPLLGVIPRECPATPLGELLFEVQSCKSDADCWPRVCCPDGARSYCRTAKARLDLVPIANQIDGPVRMLEQYLQCTPPPKQDLFPQRCSSSVDCFPNLCCAEGGKKNCRPPQRSLLALLAGVTQRVGSSLGNLRLGSSQSNNKV